MRQETYDDCLEFLLCCRGFIQLLRRIGGGLVQSGRLLFQSLIASKEYLPSFPPIAHCGSLISSSCSTLDTMTLVSKAIVLHCARSACGVGTRTLSTPPDHRPVKGVAAQERVACHWLPVAAADLL